MLEIVKSDTLDKTIKIMSNGSPLGSSTLSHVYFSSSGLNITKDLTYNSSGQYYILTLSSSETNGFTPGVYSFDITIVTTSNKRRTVVYEDAVQVLPKNNTVVV